MADKAKRQRVTGSVEGEFASPKSEATLTVKEALPPIAEDYRPALYFSNYARSLVQRVREKNTDVSYIAGSRIPKPASMCLQNMPRPKMIVLCVGTVSRECERCFGWLVLYSS